MGIGVATVAGGRPDAAWQSLTAALSRVNWQARLRLQGAESVEDESKVMAELREAFGEYFDRTVPGHVTTFR